MRGLEYAADGGEVRSAWWPGEGRYHRPAPCRLNPPPAFNVDEEVTSTIHLQWRGITSRQGCRGGIELSAHQKRVGRRRSILAGEDP